MHLPSPFTRWLLSQRNRQDDIGRFAVHVSQLAWPVSEGELVTLRNFLLTTGNASWAPTLERAFQQFQQTSQSHHRQRVALRRAMRERMRKHGVPVAAAALPLWLESGRPDRFTTELLAEANDPSALAIVGARFLLGNECNANSTYGTELLRKSFQGGCVDAAAILYHHFLLRNKYQDAISWLYQGALAGDPFCAIQLARSAASPILSVVEEFIGVPEIKRLLENNVGDNGHVEALIGADAWHDGNRERAEQHLNIAVVKGWTPAYHRLAEVFYGSGLHVQGRDALQLGASQKDVACCASLACLLLSGNHWVTSEQEREKHYRSIERGINVGGSAGLTLLAAAYLNGNGLPCDREKARIFASIGAFFPNSSRHSSMSLLLKIAGLDEADPRGLAINAAKWSFDVAEQTKSWAAYLRAAQIWTVFGMQMPVELQEN